MTETTNTIECVWCNQPLTPTDGDWITCPNAGDVCLDCCPCCN